MRPSNKRHAINAINEIVWFLAQSETDRRIARNSNFHYRFGLHRWLLLIIQVDFFSRCVRRLTRFRELKHPTVRIHFALSKNERYQKNRKQFLSFGDALRVRSKMKRLKLFFPRLGAQKSILDSTLPSSFFRFLYNQPSHQTAEFMLLLQFCCQFIA